MKSRDYIVIKCAYCGNDCNKLLKNVKYAQENGYNLFCSKECSEKNQSSSVMVNCSNCGEPVKRTKSQLNRSKSGNSFCNKSCSNSYHNKQNKYKFIDGSSVYRRNALKAYDSVCAIDCCNYNIEEVLEVHHKDGNRKNNKIENLMILCPTHHKEYTVGIRK